MAKAKTKLIMCHPKTLPQHLWVPAAAKAAEVNPVNRPNVRMMAIGAPHAMPEPAHIALLTTKYWGAAGVRLTVGFLDNAPADLRARILLHMNAWGQTANVQFSLTASVADAQVRIARTPGDGYWSYIGTDILMANADEPTMNLESFTMQTEDSEFFRVVRHETGHTLGFPHEHLREDIVAKIIPAKAYAYFLANDGWNKDTVDANVLTPLEDSEIITGSQDSDELSIMCYQLPGEIMSDGQPVPGGTDIDPTDAAFAALIYPSGQSGTSDGNGAGQQAVAGGPTTSGRVARVVPSGLEDLIEAASRASLRALEAQAAQAPPSGSAAKQVRQRIFLGIVASEE
jgi:hypothetical protein